MGSYLVTYGPSRYTWHNLVSSINLCVSSKTKCDEPREVKFNENKISIGNIAKEFFKISRMNCFGLLGIYFVSICLMKDSKRNILLKKTNLSGWDNFCRFLKRLLDFYYFSVVEIQNLTKTFCSLISPMGCKKFLLRHVSGFECLGEEHSKQDPVIGFIFSRARLQACTVVSYPCGCKARISQNFCMVTFRGFGKLLASKIFMHQRGYNYFSSKRFVPQHQKTSSRKPLGVFENLLDCFRLHWLARKVGRVAKKEE